MDRYINRQEEYLPSVGKMKTQELLNALKPCSLCVRNIKNSTCKETCRYTEMWNEMIQRGNFKSNG